MDIAGVQVKSGPNLFPLLRAAQGNGFCCGLLGRTEGTHKRSGSASETSSDEKIPPGPRHDGDDAPDCNVPSLQERSGVGHVPRAARRRLTWVRIKHEKGYAQGGYVQLPHCIGDGVSRRQKMKGKTGWARLMAVITAVGLSVLVGLGVGLTETGGAIAALAPTQQPMETVQVHLGTPKGQLIFEPDHLEFKAGHRYQLLLDNPSPLKHYFTAKDFADVIWTCLTDKTLRKEVNLLY